MPLLAAHCSSVGLVSIQNGKKICRRTLHACFLIVYGPSPPCVVAALACSIRQNRDRECRNEGGGSKPRFCKTGRLCAQFGKTKVGA